jgi:3-oxoacyl-[acyl-carrier protein] reductase
MKEFPDEKFLVYACDFTISDNVQRLKADILQLWGGLDILIANVGSGKSVRDPVPEEEHFNLVFSKNFGSAVNAVREFLPLLKESKGNILFISSIAGMETIGAPIDYSVAKSAVISFSKNLSSKVAEYGVRVNCIAPGNVYFKDGTWDEKLKADADKVKQYIASVVPMNRFGTPEEIAMPCLFLCSDRASFITGSLLCVDGGQTKGILA